MIPIKNRRDIEEMRLACQTAAGVRDRLAAMIQPGVTTGEVDREAGRLIAEAGGVSAFLNYRGFPGQICISLNEEVVHGIGGTRKIQYGDIVKIDIGVILKGWVGDTALTIPAGIVDEPVNRLIQTTEEAFFKGLEHIRAGERLGDYGAAVEAHVKANGFTVVREFVGHGVGRSLHEEPQIPNYGRPGSGARLKAGMTLAIEPMVNLGSAGVKILADGWTVVTTDKKPSAHYEHTVLVTDGEPEILTLRGQP